MEYVLAIVIFVACAAMVFLVVIQKSKGGGLATNLQGSQALAQQMGMRRATDFVEKATWYVMGIIAIAAFVTTISMSSGTQQQSGFNLRTSSAIQNASVPAPAAPAGTPTLQPAAPANGGTQEQTAQ